MDRRSRRQTLGVLSTNALHARRSLGGGARLKRTKSSGRKSLAPSTRLGGNARTSLGGRRSSMGRNSRPSLSRRQSSVHGKLRRAADPRPIGDKAFQNANIRRLITFLVGHKFYNAISTKTLTSPTKNDFKDILEFLLCQIDPNFGFTDKFEEEVKAYFALLGYPFTISKSALLAVGSPHTWPSLLAALVWLIELIEHTEGVAEADEQEAAEGGGGLGDLNSSAQFFRFLECQYSVFLNGEFDMESLEDELVQHFSERDNVVQMHVERLRTETTRLDAEIEALKAADSELPELKQKRADFMTDVGKFDKLLQKLGKYEEKLQVSLGERRAEQEIKEAQLRELQAEREALQVQIEQQDFSPAEVQRMTQEKALLEESLGALDKQKEELQKQIWDLELSLCKKQEEVEALVQQFNDKATQLQLIPSTAKYASGVDFEIHVDANADSPDKIVSSNLRDVIKQALMHVRELFQDRIRSAQEDQREITEQHDKLTSQLADKEKEVAELNERHERVQKQYRDQRDEMNAELKQIVAQVNETEDEMNRIRSTASSALSLSEKNVAALETEVAQVRETVAEEAENMHSEIVLVLDELAQHKLDVTGAAETLMHRAFAASEEVQRV